MRTRADRIAEARQLRAEHMSLDLIAGRFGVSRSTAQRWCAGVPPDELPGAAKRYLDCFEQWQLEESARNFDARRHALAMLLGRQPPPLERTGREAPRERTKD